METNVDCLEDGLRLVAARDMHRQVSRGVTGRISVGINAEELYIVKSRQKSARTEVREMGTENVLDALSKRAS